MLALLKPQETLKFLRTKVKMSSQQEPKENQMILSILLELYMQILQDPHLVILYFQPSFQKNFCQMKPQTMKQIEMKKQ